MTEPTPSVEPTDDTGLNLFDDRASAAGSFPHTMFGYDRPTVDNYVRDLEQQLATLRQLTRHLRTELAGAQREHGDTDFTRLGSHATTMLRAAEAQATELISRAAAEAERIKEEGRRVAADLRANAQTEADDIRVETLSNLREMRERLAEESAQVREATQSDCQVTVEAARVQAQALIDEATHNATLATEESTAQLRQLAAEANRDATALRANAQSQAEQIVSQAHEQAQQLIAAANAEAAQVAEEVASLQAATQTLHASAVAQVAQATEDAGRIRTDALAAAEELREQAAQEAESQIAASHRQSAMMKDRIEEQFAWRKEQLEREVSVLTQRKDTIIAQMGNLRQLAEDATADYPNADPFAAAEPETPRTDAEWLAAAPVPVGTSASEPTAVLRDQRGAGPDATEDPDKTVIRGGQESGITDQEGNEITTIIDPDQPEPTKVIPID